MKCSICGRKLKNPKSRELGYGPVCYKRKFGCSPRTSRREKCVASLIEKVDCNLPGQISIDEYLRTAFGEQEKERALQNG